MSEMPRQAGPADGPGISVAAPPELDPALAALPLASVFAALERAVAFVTVTRGADHVVHWRNGAARAALQAGPELRPIREVHRAIPASVLAALDSVFATGVAETVAKVPLRARDGGPVLAVDASITRIDDAQGQPWGLLVVAVDASRRLDADRATARLALLAAASDVVAGELDAEIALRALADLLVPQLADVVGVYLTDEALLARVTDAMRPAEAASGSLQLPGDIARRVALATARRADGSAVTPAPRVAFRSSRDPVVRVLLTREPVLEESFTAHEVLAWTSDAAAAQWMIESGAHSLMAVPLVVSGRVAGVVSALATGSRPAFSEDDLDFLGEIAGRASTAVTHAAEYTAQRRTALTLQSTLLPRRPPDIPGIAVATRYVAGAVGVDVGGDWWDVIDLGAGRAGLCIGDVAGRGISAAAVMGQLRTALRTAAHADLPPVDALRALDGLLADLGLADDRYAPRGRADIAPVRFATALYATYEPRDGLLYVANAGHLPPLLVDADGTVRRVEGGGTPLGTEARDVHELSVPFGPGTTLALYTDGLVEDRRTDIDEGLDRLSASLARGLTSGADLEAVADAVLADLGRAAGHDDDVALLLVRADETARPIASYAVSLYELSRVADARRGAAELLRATGASGEVDVVSLAVTELLANALTHVGSTVDLYVDVAADRIVVEVCDIGGRLPRQQQADVLDEHGRGLLLLDALADRWGVRLIREGKSTWAEFPRSTEN